MKSEPSLELTAVVRHNVLVNPYTGKRYITYAGLPIELHDVWEFAEERAEELSRRWRHKQGRGENLIDVFSPSSAHLFHVPANQAKLCLNEALKSLRVTDPISLLKDKEERLPQPAVVWGWATVKYGKISTLGDYTEVYAPVRLGKLCYRLTQRQIEAVRKRFLYPYRCVVHDANGRFRASSPRLDIPQGFVIRYRVFFHNTSSLIWLWNLCLGTEASRHEKMTFIEKVLDCMTSSPL